MALGRVLVYSLSWYLEDLSKTFLLLEPYTHNKKKNSSSSNRQMKGWYIDLSLHMT